jgi:RNA polymerase sigma factor (TIGR02999 family)
VKASIAICFNCASGIICKVFIALHGFLTRIFMKESPQEITDLLSALGRGDQSAAEQLLPLVEKELRRLAKGYLRKVKKVPSLQTTVLIDDAFLKLIDQKRVHWQNRKHFYGVAATCMRRILLDYVKAENRHKRGGGAEHVPLSDVELVSIEKSAELLALDEALHKLAKKDARQSQIVEMQFFCGYNLEEIAELLDVPNVTVELEWRMARAWLQREMAAQP